jgi:hypothetical protein
MKVDRVGADRVGLCKLFRAVATVACHKALIPPPHLRLAFDQQDLSFITSHTLVYSLVLSSCF